MYFNYISIHSTMSCVCTLVKLDSVLPILKSQYLLYLHNSAYKFIVYFPNTYHCVHCCPSSHTCHHCYSHASARAAKYYITLFSSL